MKSRVKTAFGALVVFQAAHSMEEYVGRLWESFPPATFVSGLVSSNRELGFVIINIALVAFALWCFLFPLRRNWPSARAFLWLWIAVEIINGFGHPIWTLRQRAYTPGVATAPILLVLALYLTSQMLKVPARGLPR
jgi:hypothetical protein